MLRCKSKLTLKGLLYINSLLCTRLEVWNPAFRLAERHRTFRGNLHISLAIVFTISQDNTNHSLVLLYIDLIPQYNKRKAIWVSRRSLDQELVSPAIKRIETL